MNFEKHSIESNLETYIESIFYFKDFVPEHSIERVVPTGHIFIIFELDGIPRKTFNNETLEPTAIYKTTWVSGMHKNYISISAHKNSEMFVIQFKPAGAFPFFHFPISDLNDKVIPAEEVLGAELLQLREKLKKENKTKNKFCLAEEWLNKRFDPRKKVPQDLIQFLKKIKSEPAADYQSILSEYPNSQKHLINQFKKYVGLKPKDLQRIFRFNDVLNKIQKNENLSWSQIAYQCGFSDQSHFVKEFNFFSGFNPGKFIKEEYHMDETNFFPLDRKG